MNRYLTFVIAAALLFAANTAFSQERNASPFPSSAKTRVVTRRPDKSPAYINPTSFRYRSLGPATLKQPVRKMGAVVRMPAKSPAEFRQRSSTVYARVQLQPKPQRKQIHRQNKITRVSPPKKPVTPNPFVKQKPSLDSLKTEVVKTQTTIIDYKFEIVPLTAPVTEALTSAPKVKPGANVLDTIGASIRDQSQTTSPPSPLKSTKLILTKAPIAIAATHEVQALDSNDKTEPSGLLGDDIAPQARSKANRTEDPIASVATTDLATQFEESGTLNAAVEVSNTEAPTKESRGTSVSRPTSRQVKATNKWWVFLPLILVPALGCLGWIIYIAPKEFQRRNQAAKSQASVKRPMTYRQFKEGTSAATVRPLATGLASRDTKATDTPVANATTNTTHSSAGATPAATTGFAAESTSTSASGTTDSKSTMTYRQWKESTSGNKAGLPTSATTNSTGRTSDQSFKGADNLEEQRSEQARSKQYAATASRAGSRSSKPDDLTKISGIGPATQEALGAKGIHRFEQLANLSLEQLNDLLADMGSRFILQNTSTWSAQAQSFVSQRSSDENFDIELLEDINSIRAIGAGSKCASKAGCRSKSDNM